MSLRSEALERIQTNSPSSVRCDSERSLVSNKMIIPQHFGPQGSSAVAQALEHNTTRVHLFNPTPSVAEDVDQSTVFSVVFKRPNTELRKISMCSCIGIQTAIEMVDSLVYNKTVTHFDLIDIEDGYVNDATTQRLIGNKLNTVLQNNTTLHFLRMARFKLDDVFLQQCTKGMSINTTINELNLSFNHINGAVGGRALSEVLKTNTTLTKLGLNVNNIGPEFIQYFAVGLETNKTLLELDLAENSIECQGIIYLMDRLLKNQSLRRLCLSGNQIGDSGAKSISTFLRHNTTLECLLLSRNDFSEDGIVRILKALEFNESLTTVSFPMPKNIVSKSKIKVYQALQQLLQHNDTLMDCTIDFKDQTINKILNEFRNRTRTAPKKGARLREGIYYWILQEWVGLDTFSRSTQQNIKLQNRILAGHDIGTEFVNGYTPNTYTNTTFSQLDFRCNNMNNIPNASTALADMLQHNSVLTKLDLSSNNICDEFVQALAAGLRSRSGLLELDLSQNFVGSRGVVALMGALNYCAAITKLDLSQNQVDDDSISSITKFLRHSTTMKHLDLSYNQLCDDGVITTLTAMEYNESLTTIHLYENKINTKADIQTILLRVLQYNDTLEQCDFGFNNGISNKLLKENLSGRRRAPYKGKRKREDLFSWLQSAWVSW